MSRFMNHWASLSATRNLNALTVGLDCMSGFVCRCGRVALQLASSSLRAFLGCLSAWQCAIFLSLGLVGRVHFGGFLVDAKSSI